MAKFPAIEYKKFVLRHCIFYSENALKYWISSINDFCARCQMSQNSTLPTLGQISLPFRFDVQGAARTPNPERAYSPCTPTPHAL